MVSHAASVWGATSQSRLASTNPRIKLLTAAAGLLLNITATTIFLPLGVLAISTAVLFTEGVSRKTVIRRLLIPLYMATAVFATQLFWVGEVPLWQIGPLTAHQEGLFAGALIASRMLGGAALLLAFVQITPITEILALSAWLRLPSVLLEVAVLVFRYVFLLAEEAGRLREAQKQRLGYSGWRKGLKSAGTLCGAVIIRSYDRGEAVYDAMIARGYTGTMPLSEARRFTNADWAAAAIIVILAGLIFALERAAL